MSTTVLERYQFRKDRVRKKISGFPDKPRLSVYRSLKHIYAQIIDDSIGKTLVSASSLELTKENKSDKKFKSETAKKVGQLIAEKAKAASIQKVVFDRGARIYHGRVKSLAEGAREKGLQF